MSKKSLIATAAGTAFVAGMAAAPIASAAENPFALTGLANGYQVAQAAKMPAGKCGQGMCGAAMKKSVPEAKCGAAMLDANKDGKISKDEFVNGHAAMFDALDTNKDGSLDQAEMGKMMPGKCGATK
jgi:uncharacterized low-complexity protein